MSEATILTEELTEDVTVVRVNRPEKLNAMNLETLRELDDVLEQCTENPGPLILASAGDRAFIAGADLEYMQGLSVPEAQAYADLGHRVANRLESFPAPTIAAVDGYAFGGGCELALACDVRIASESAVIGQTEIDLGIIPGWGGSQRLPRLVGDELARRLIFGGDRIDAETAHEYGLVGEVVADDEVDDRARELAASYAEKPTFALAAAKEAIDQSHEMPLEAGLEYEKRVWSGLFGTHDQREGMAAFLEDRTPEFE